MTINERLRTLRKSHGLKLREVSEITGLSIPHISDVERGRNEPSLVACGAFCRCYEMTLENLFHGVTIIPGVSRGVRVVKDGER